MKYEPLTKFEVDCLAETMSRAAAIDTCITLGNQFVEHFNKVCNKGISLLEFQYHCSEMQKLYTAALDIKLRYPKRYIYLTNLYDWFFSCGTDFEDFIRGENIDTYEYLVNKLITTDKGVLEILVEVV